MYVWGGKISCVSDRQRDKVSEGVSADIWVGGCFCACMYMCVYVCVCVCWCVCVCDEENIRKKMNRVKHEQMFQ